jgi:hypothetical protein
MTICGGPARIVHRAVELHDTKVLSCRQEGGSLLMRLDAYVHQSTGEPGVDQGTGWSQQVDLIVANVTVAALPAKPDSVSISEGTLSIDGQSLSLLPLPLKKAGRICLRLLGDDGSELVVDGTAVQLSPAGDPTFIERVPSTR